MSFLEEFDRHAGGEKPVETEGQNRELLEFADLIRRNRALPDPAERERIMARVRRAQQARPSVRPARPGWRRSRRWVLSAAGAAAALLVTAVLLSTMRGQAVRVIPVGPEPASKDPAPEAPVAEAVTAPPAPRLTPKRFTDEFAGISFPKPKAAPAGRASEVEKPGDRDRARLLRTGGLTLVRRSGQKRWRLLARGDGLAPGDSVRTGVHRSSAAVILGPDGSRLTLLSGGEMTFAAKRSWKLDSGEALFSVASGGSLGSFSVSTPHGSVRALGTEFALAVESAGAGRRAGTICRVTEGRVELGAKSARLTLGAGSSGLLEGGKAVSWTQPLDDLWRRAASEPGSAGGVGELLASAVGGKSEAQPLEIRSHRVTVTVVEQVARTFLDEVFVNNTGSRMEGVFYYPLPPDAAISEFAMYVNGVRVEGEVLEQQRARQIFEYIVRQRRDPALLEFAGGNIFKMRIFPIEPHSTKRIQLGYTQVLPRRSGTVTYTYPLVSEKLLKNPLHELSIDFRVLSSHGLEKLTSPTHRVASAMGADGLRGALSFRASEYSPTRDFSVTYNVTNAPECAAFGHRSGESGAGNYFMLQLCPRLAMPSRPAPSKIVLVVDGSASAGPQEYAVAAELAGTIAEMSAGCRLAVVRGGQKAELMGEGFVKADAGIHARVKRFLGGRAPLGATDLVATFGKAAGIITPGERVQLLYVGDGVETVGELEGGALVNALLRLFEGRDVEISCAAVGASYDRAVLSGLAGATGGSFVRVEGAADVHVAAGQVTDAFYTPTLRRVRVEVEGLDVSDVYPAEETSLAEGDTLVVLGRAGKSGRGRVTLRAEAGGRPVEKSWDVELEAAKEVNRFLPRLWAKAHIDALLAGMGLCGEAEDARRRERVIDTSVYYQIMSPFTAFLVLESEQDYARFGIRRQKREWDWHGDQNGVGSVTNDLEQGAQARIAVPDPAAPKTFAESPEPGPPAPQPVIVDERMKKVYNARVDHCVVYDDKMREGKRLEADVRFSLPEDTRWSLPSGEFEEMLEFRKKESLSMERAELKDDLDAIHELGRGRYWYDPRYGGRSRLYQHSSPILSSGAVVGLKIDRPLKSSAVYQRKVKDGDASLSLRLNLALALGSEGRVKEAIAELQKVIAALPELPDLRLELGALLHRGGDVKGAHEAFEKAIELAPENERANVRARVQNFFTSTGNYQGLAEWTEAQAAANENPAEAAGLLGAAGNYWSNAGRGDKARALWSRTAAAYGKLGRESADLTKAAGWYSNAASYIANAGDQRGAREFYGRAAECHEKVARKATEEQVRVNHLNAAAITFRNAGRDARAKQLFAESAGIYEKLAAREKTAEVALGWVRQTAEAWRMAGRSAAGLAAWEAALKRFPDSGQLPLAAGIWLMNHGIDNSRAADLFLRAREKGTDPGDGVYNALVRAGRRDEAVAEIRGRLKKAKDVNAVYQQLWKLHQLGTDAFRAESCRLLETGSPVLVGGAIQALQNHGESRNRTIRDALARAATSGKFPAAYRVSAFHLLRGSGATRLKVGEKSVALAAVLEPLFEKPKTAEEFGLAVAAVQALQGQGMKEEALARARELAAMKELPAGQRPTLSASEVSVLCSLNRWKQADELVARLLAGAKTEAEIQGPVGTAFWTHLNSGRAGAAEKLVDALAASFPESPYAPQLYRNLLQNLRQTGRADAAAGIAARLFAKKPADLGWAKSHANFLAAKGRFREAAEALRRCLKLNPVPASEETGDDGQAQAPTREQVLRRRHVLVILLARICAQDAELRAAFMKEADAAAGEDSPTLRTWTRAALVCLEEAADYEKLISRLEELNAKSPEDVVWLARLAEARLRSGDEAGAAREFERLFKKRPERYDLALRLRALALRANDAGAAASWTKQAMDALERNPAQFHNMAYHWQSSRSHELALEAFKRLQRTGNYGNRTSFAWSAAQSAMALGRIEDEVKYMALASRAENTGYASNFIQRIGKLLEDPKAETAARKAARKAFDAWKAEIGSGGAVGGGELYCAGELALRLELWADATDLYIRAARAAAGGHSSAAVNQLCGLTRNPRARKIAEPRALKLLEEWLRCGADLPRVMNGPAKQLAEFMGRRDDAIRFCAQGIPELSGGPRGAASELIRLADTPERRELAGHLFTKAVSEMPEARREVWTHLFRWKVALAGKDGETARRELSAAAAVDIPRGEPGLIQEVSGALGEAGEKERLLQYVLAKAGRLERNWKINVLNNGVSLLGDDERSLRLRRTLVEIDESNRHEQRRQLIECLVRMGRLEDAAAEMKNLEVGRNPYYVRTTFRQVINAFWSTGKPDRQRRAMDLALWSWKRFNCPEGQGYGREFFSRLIDFCSRAEAKGQLDEKFADEVIDAIRSSCRGWFSLEEGQYRDPNYWWNSNSFLDKRKLRAEIDAMASAAAASGDVGRVVRAAEYYNGRGSVAAARKAWRRVLSLGGYNEQSALSRLYSLCSQDPAPDWQGALKCVERLREMGVYRGSSYLTARLPCLYGLKRREEARDVLEKLLSPEERIENLGYGWFDSVGQICERGGDWKGAARAWEASIRIWRFYNARQRGSYWYQVMWAYRRAANAYAKAGDADRSLECCLRGLSVIPRDSAESYYRQLMEQLVADILKAKALDKAVAEYEKGVEAGGGAEKPHLRVAFAEAYTRAGKHAEALRHLRIAADLMPKDLRLRERVVSGYKKLKDEKGVIESYLAWARIDPQNIRIYDQLGDYYKSLGREDEAWAAWATMAEVRPREAEGYRAYAGRLASAGRDAQAASALRKALRYRPTEFGIAEELAGAYRRLKQPEKIKELWAAGEKACRRAMKDFADDPLPWLNLVRFLKAQGRRDEAREMCDRICRRSWPRFGGETTDEARRLRQGL